MLLYVVDEAVIIAVTFSQIYMDISFSISLFINLLSNIDITYDMHSHYLVNY